MPVISKIPKSILGMARTAYRIKDRFGPGVFKNAEEAGSQLLNEKCAAGKVITIDVAPDGLGILFVTVRKQSRNLWDAIKVLFGKAYYSEKPAVSTSTKDIEIAGRKALLDYYENNLPR